MHLYLHPSKTFFPIDVADEGKDIGVKVVQKLKASSPIEVIDEGFSNDILVNEVHFLKAQLAISVTQEGIIISVNDEQK